MFNVTDVYNWWLYRLCGKIDSRGGNPGDNRCLITVDGTDCKIYEPTPFDPKWFSHKFLGPGVRYEVGICIVTGKIVWVHGPFPCGDWPDLRIFRNCLMGCLAPREFVIADGGYYDGYEYTVTPTGANEWLDSKESEARARHETVNRRFKQFNVIGSRFRHNKHLHGICFRAVANIVELMIETNSPLFNVEYDESMFYE